MDIVNQTLIMVFLGIIAVSLIVFPTLYLVQRHNHHKELIKVLENRSHNEL